MLPLLEKVNKSNTIVIGRDARVSGKMVSSLVSGTLISCGFDVLDVGLSTTPTIEVAVQLEKSAEVLLLLLVIILKIGMP